MMKVAIDLRRLPQILVALLLIFPAANGKPLSSPTENNSPFKESTGNIKDELSNSKPEINASVSEYKNSGHNNLLSDLARISKDEETNVGNTAQTIVGTEVSAAPIKNTKGNSVDTQSDTRTLVTSTPTEAESTISSYLSTPSPTNEVIDGTGTTTSAKNDTSLVRLSEPTHIVLSKSKDEENPFSKLITSNENIPADEAKSNDAVNKPQGLSPLISERTGSAPSESSDVKDSAITGPVQSTGSIGQSTGSVGQSTGSVGQSTGSVVPSTGSVGQSTGYIGQSAGPIHDSGGSIGLESIDLSENDDESKQQESKDIGAMNNEQGFNEGSASEKALDDTEKSEEKSKNVDKDASKADRVVVCAGEKQTITCPEDSTLNINSAAYGYDSNSGCPIDTSSPTCQANGVYPVVRSACQGQVSCLLQSDGQEFGGMCPGQSNYLKVGYSCQNKTPSLASPPPSASSQPVTAASSQLPASPYSYQTSPYIPHPVSTQPASYYNYAYNPSKANSYSTRYMNDNNPQNNPYYGYYGNQGYYNYYNSPSQGHLSQSMGNYYGYKPRLPPSNPSARPRQPPRPQLPRNDYGRMVNTQYQEYSNRYSPKNFNYYNSRKNYYGKQLTPLAYRQPYPRPQYPRNSYLGSCYACQNCQQCSEQAYCQGCPKCKELPCDKKRLKEEKYLDPIDSLVEEFGKKTKGMTPMEMSAVVISPVPKVPEIAHSLPLQPPPKPLEEEDDDDDDNDSDENEFTLSEGEDESDNHEIEDHEGSLTQKKTSVSSSKSRLHSAKDKQLKRKAEKSKKRKSKKIEKHNDHGRTSSLAKHHAKDDDDDEDGYDFKIIKKFKQKKPKRSKIHRHKYVHHDSSATRRKSRKHVSKRWYDEDGDLQEADQFVLDQNEDRHIDSPYYYDTMVW